MADRVEWFEITIPAGTPIAAPITVPCVFGDGDVVEVDVKVPPGPSGTVGFFIGAGGSQYIPRTAGSFIIPDDDYFTWPMQNAINSGSWSLTGYNTDAYPHTIQVFFQVNEGGDAHVMPKAAASTASDLLATAVSSAQPSGAPAIDPLSADFLLSPVDLTVA